MKISRTARNFALSIAATGVAGGLSFLTWPLLSHMLWAPFFAAVVFSARVGGMPAAYLCIILSATIGDYFFLEPYWAFGDTLESHAPTGTFIVIALIVSFLGSAIRDALEIERWQKRGFFGILSSIGDAVIAADTTGRVTFTNLIADRLTGWSPEDAVGRSIDEVLHVLDPVTGQPLPAFRLYELESEDTVQNAKRFILEAKDGSHIPIEKIGAPIKNSGGDIAGAVYIFRDISHRQTAEIAQSRLASLVEWSNDAIVSKNLDGVVTSWNRGAERIFGYLSEEMVGRHISTVIPPDLLDEEDVILSRIRSGERVEHYETRRRRKDGQLVNVSLTISPIRDGSGKIIGASKIARDITQQKQQEVERIEADRRKDEFLAMLAHELRNPLASISNAVQLFDYLKSEKDLEWSKDVLRRQVKHLSRLIDDLLDVSRISSGKISLKMEPLNLSTIVARSAEAARPLIDERRHRFEVSLPTEEVPVHADPARLEQTLVNLLTNAAKYTDPGGQIWLSVSCEGPNAVVKVRDNGVGIRPELQPHVFDLFVQEVRSTSRSEGGLGVGLTIAKKLTELHGGTLSVSSEGAGKGSEFTLQIPLTAVTVATPVEGPSLDAQSPSSGRVLIVDDNVDTAAGLKKLMTIFGYDAQVAYDGLAALHLAKTIQPEYVLLDIGLPGMDGYEVAERLRAEGPCEKSLIIAISGYGQAKDRSRSKEAGFDYHLVKPVDHGQLISLMHQRSEA